MLSLSFSRFVYLLLATLSLLSLLKYVQAKHNVTIDNKNSAISYSGDWEFQDDYDNGASDHWTNDDDAEAEFKFTGVAVYYQVHLYPNQYPARALLSVDDKTPKGVVLYDPQSDDYGRKLSTVFSVEGLQNNEHTLRVKPWPNDDEDNFYITLDTIVFTVLDDEDTHTSSSSSSSTSSSATSTSSTSATSTPSAESDNDSRRIKAATVMKYTGIAIGGLVALGFIATIGPLLYRRHLANKTAHKFTPLPGGFASASNQQMRTYNYSSVSNADAEAQNPFIAPSETAYNGAPAYSHHPQGATRYGS